MSLTIANLVSASGGRLWRSTPPTLTEGVSAPVELRTPLCGAAADSREVVAGGAFFALAGAVTHGHAFVGDAFARGARLAVVSDVTACGDVPEGAYLCQVPDPLRALHAVARWWRRHLGVTVVGITGSIGKTSTKEAIAAALAPLGTGRVLKARGNRNTEVGLPLELLRLTPEHQVAVLEMGMYQRGDIAELATIAEPSMGVVTSVLPVHLERLGHIDRIAQAKAELVHALPAHGLAVLNGDDARVRDMAGATRAPAVLFGLERRYDVWADDVEGHGLRGFTATYHHGWRSVRITSPTPGEHNVVTLLPAIALAHRLDVAWHDIGDALRSFRLPERLAVLRGPNGSTILDDRYNAMAASVCAALRTLRQEPGRHFAILGEMYELGDEEEAQHRMVGRAAAEAALAGLILLGERTRWIAEEAHARGLEHGRIVVAGTAQEAVEAAAARLGPGDTVLVKGSRGLRMEEIVDALRQEPPTTRLRTEPVTLGSKVGVQ